MFDILFRFILGIQFILAYKDVYDLSMLLLCMCVWLLYLFRYYQELFSSLSIASPNVSPLPLFVVICDCCLDLFAIHHCQLLCVMATFNCCLSVLASYETTLIVPFRK